MSPRPSVPPLDPSSVAREFVENSGFPHEIRVVRAFEAAGFRSFPSVSYEDEGTGDAGEIDLLAFREVEETGASFRLSYVVECKRSTDIPWLLFRSTTGGTRIDAFQRSLLHLTSRGIELLLHTFASDWKHLLRLTEPLNGVASRVRDAKENRDVAYKAVAAVLRAARIQIEGTNAAQESAKRDRTPIPFEIIRPVVVLGGSLFYCDFAADGRFDLVETERGAVLASPPRAWPRSVLLDVVTERGLSSYLDEQKAVADQLLDVVRAPLRKQTEFWARQYDRQDNLGAAAPIAGGNS